jgi:hypothetical protein
MSNLEKLSSRHGRRAEDLNKILARELVDQYATDGIKEIVEHLSNPDKHIQSDCASVLEEVGRLEPELLTPYITDYLALLKNKNNRMVWGGMILLAMTADRVPDELFSHRETLIQAIQTGSVITQDQGIKTLALVAAAKPSYNEALFPFFLDHLHMCRPKSLPQHSESVALAVTVENKDRFLAVIMERQSLLSPPQLRRTQKLLQTISSLEET